MADNDSSFQRYFSPQGKVLGSTQSSFCVDMLNKSYFGNNDLHDAADDCSKNWSSERSISKIINQNNTKQCQKMQYLFNSNIHNFLNIKQTLI